MEYSNNHSKECDARVRKIVLLEEQYNSLSDGSNFVFFFLPSFLMKPDTHLSSLFGLRFLFCTVFVIFFFSVFTEKEAKIVAEGKLIEEFKWKVKSFGNFSDIVKFNVGGKIFTTSRNVFATLPMCFFTVLLAESPNDNDGCYYVDRDADLFECILDFLSGTDISKRLQDTKDLEKIEEEAKFYGIGEAMQKIIERERSNRWTIAPTLNGTLSPDGLTLKKTGDSGDRACISLGTQGWRDGVHEFTVEILEGGGAHLGVGISGGGIDQTNLRKNVPLFYALDCGNGRAIGIGVSRVVIEKVEPGGEV